MTHHDPRNPMDVSNVIDANYVPCVSRDTKIITDQDEVSVQDLFIGDRVFAPDGNFDTVERIICLPPELSRSAAVMCYPAQSVGNHSELRISPGCKVFGRNSGPLEKLRLLPNSVYVHSQELACRRIGSFAFYCIVLQQERTVMANGAVVSALNMSDLANLESGQIAHRLLA